MCEPTVLFFPVYACPDIMRIIRKTPGKCPGPTSVENSFKVSVGVKETNLKERTSVL